MPKCFTHEDTVEWFVVRKDKSLQRKIDLNDEGWE